MVLMGLHIHSDFRWMTVFAVFRLPNLHQILSRCAIYLQKQHGSARY
uniref:Uncharacterized protein n=1 Tax=Rhizophora mucronata TaxID=61149 RepID=A0A2P2PSI1_RHIMU